MHLCDISVSPESPGSRKTRGRLSSGFFLLLYQALEEDASVKSSLYDYFQISPCASIACTVAIFNRMGEKNKSQFK